MSLTLFVTNDFMGQWPVGTAAIVWAVDRQTAQRRFRAAFKKAKLPDDGGKFTVWPYVEPHPDAIGASSVLILNDGNY